MAGPQRLPHSRGRGTLVELAEYDSGPTVSVTAALTYDLTEKQSLRLLAAPLRIETSFTPDAPVVFQDLVYPAGRPIEARFAFDSYRLSWSWRFTPRGRWSFRLGATLKVRSAEIGLALCPAAMNTTLRRDGNPSGHSHPGSTATSKIRISSSSIWMETGMPMC